MAVTNKGRSKCTPIKKVQKKKKASRENIVITETQGAEKVRMEAETGKRNYERKAQLAREWRIELKLVIKYIT